MTTTTRHPLDRLSEARDFAEATLIYEDGCCFELQYATDEPRDDLDGRSSVDLWQSMIERARAARRIAATHAPESAVRALRGFGMEEFAAALQTGDWHHLAF